MNIFDIKIIDSVHLKDVLIESNIGKKYRLNYIPNPKQFLTMWNIGDTLIVQSNSIYGIDEIVLFCLRTEKHRLKNSLEGFIGTEIKE